MEDDYAPEFVSEWLKGFNLAEETLVTMRRVLQRRQMDSISIRMSREAQTVIKQLKAETSFHKEDGDHKADENSKSNANTVKTPRKSCRKLNTSNTKKFAETFSKNLSFRLDGDITESAQSENLQEKNSLTGDHVEVSMETVQIINVDKPRKENDTDEIAIEETAKLNSIDKCIVWMEVNDSEVEEGINNSRTTTPHR